MLSQLKDFTLDKEFRITIFSDKIHIINYSRIDTITDNKLIIRNNNDKILITGAKFSLLKLLDNELLMQGNIKNIEVFNNE